VKVERPERTRINQGTFRSPSQRKTSPADSGLGGDDGKRVGLWRKSVVIRLGSPAIKVWPWRVLSRKLGIDRKYAC
jgi:hypothetical protein